MRRGSVRPTVTLLAGLVLAVTVAVAAHAAEYVAVPGATYASVLSKEPVTVAPFSMRTEPVTTAEFAAFIAHHTEWQPGKVDEIFADKAYLSASTEPDDAGGRRPVTSVSWFAANAFCEGEGARLPTWSEWEFVAAADETRGDARTDPAWRAKILTWYAEPASHVPKPVGGPANVFGVRDMHGLIWEWVEDFNALLVETDSRKDGDPDLLRFCGAGALSLQDRDNYAVLMRIALLSSLKAADTTSSLGFRCARSSN
jgi:formylglycine-generating enzyme required for sulfatase activity